MAKPKRANEMGLPPHWKVRVFLSGGGSFYLASLREPELVFKDGHLIGAEWELITGSEHGDTIGFLDWSAVTAVTWRFAPLVEEENGDHPRSRSRRKRTSSIPY